MRSSKPATGDDLARLRELEQVAADTARSFIAQGHALAAIKADKLYQLVSGGWDSYCRAAFGFTGRRANQLIPAAAVADVLTSAHLIIGTTVPEIDNEAQARELAPLLDDPQALVDLWRVACQGAAERGEKPTARYIRACREQREPRRFDEVEHVKILCAEYLPAMLIMIYEQALWERAGYRSWADLINDPAFDQLREFLLGNKSWYTEGGGYETV